MLMPREFFLERSVRIWLQVFLLLSAMRWDGSNPADTWNDPQHVSARMQAVLNENGVRFSAHTIRLRATTKQTRCVNWRIK